MSSHLFDHKSWKESDIAITDAVTGKGTETRTGRGKGTAVVEADMMTPRDHGTKAESAVEAAVVIDDMCMTTADLKVKAGMPNTVGMNMTSALPGMIAMTASIGMGLTGKGPLRTMGTTGIINQKA